MHVKLIFILAFALLVHIQHGLYTLKNGHCASYWGQFTPCSVLRDTLTGGMNATLDRGKQLQGHSSSHGNALLARKVAQGQLKDWL